MMERAEDIVKLDVSGRLNQMKYEAEFVNRKEDWDEDSKRR